MYRINTQIRATTSRQSVAQITLIQEHFEETAV